ncbi:response regulator [Pedobacter sp. SD-b]|uniref:histidine kinase n=1 Tax=Pedobacter segetis TaxID=2793069 RepID=A0ABS1BNF3_9SPHI|nr:hybrid sensor histidine kinase/response regulator transcription factor [Pedobacter segetis]MBK0384423.1 response regulator [Pedobacter segetis]
MKIYKQLFLFFGIYLLSLFIFNPKGFAQSKDLVFNHLTVANGLSNNSILSINQDSTGYIWLGSKYGLNRFDGRTFKVFTNDPENKNSISSNDFIKKIVLGDNGDIWVVSSGLDLYHPEDNSFEQIIPIGNDLLKVFKDSKGNLWIGSLKQLKFKAVNSKKIIPVAFTRSNLQVSEIFEDHQNHIWIGTSAGLFEAYFSNQKLILKKRFKDIFKYGASFNQVTSIVQDKNLKYWVGTKGNGIYSFDKEKVNIQHLTKDDGDKNSLVNNNVRKILKHIDGSLWIGTQDGLSILNPTTLSFNNYQHDPAKPNSLSQNSIYDIFQDKNGSVWIGTYFGGVNVVYSVNTPFNIYQNDITKNSISSNIISAIVEDNSRNLWIGTEAGGLNYFNTTNQQFSTYKNVIGNNSSLSSNLVKAIAIDKKQNLWIGTALGGLNFFDTKTKSFTSFKHKTSDLNSIASDNINCLITTKQNKLFIGTDLGLNIYDIEQQKFSFLTSSAKKTYLEQQITALFEDKNGMVWVGTPIGIHFYQGGKLEYKSFKDSLKKEFKYNINCFQQDSKGNMWVGTYHTGLALLDLKKNTYKIFNTTNGLPSDNILAIAEDEDTNLWISTDNGLVKYNRSLNAFRSFNIQDGLPDNQFNTHSFLKDSKGNLFFGTYNGLISFVPEKIEKNRVAPSVVLSNLKLFNVPVKISDETQLLKSDINFSNTLTFQYDQNIFTIEFSALNYIKSNKNKYAYILKGFEKQWNYVDNPSATYTNLPASNYTFLVKAANNDGVWSNKLKEIKIVVRPPFWKTWWAYLFYIAIISLIAFYIFKFFRARAKLKQDLYFEHLEAEHQQKNYQMKLDFFTNVSHEIRTPLTLILGPIEKLERLTIENTQANKYAISIKNNTERLYRLVNELLDFRKADSENLRLYFFEEDMVSFLAEIYEHFQTLAESKNIQYSFESSDTQILVYFDKDQMEKVFFNLLSNAFKFTPDNGIINLKIRRKENQVEIILTDNGKGIAINNIDDIFNNFYQAEQSMGTGIGLALSKSLITLHKGEIKVSSTPASENKDGQTIFTVLLQLGKEHLNEQDISPTSELESHFIENISEPNTEYLIDLNTVNDKKNDSHILIVEDNDELRDFIKQSLENQYHVHVSENGLEGWKKAINQLPDLIISDVMMPIMDGLELCKKLKADIRTSHIPVIMLTAKSAPIHQIHGLQHGADAYITKPFSDQILQLNIHNLLALRSALQKRYSEQLQQLPAITHSESSQDEKFLQKLHQIIEDNIDNSNLDIAFLTSEIGMSKSVLYKKFSALTNLSLNEFIKGQRLKHAVDIFQQGETNILSVAIQVGFNDAKYFSREFKKVYGITPNDYIKSKS